MFIHIQGIILTIFEMFCCKLFFEVFCKKRSKSIWVNSALILGLIVFIYSTALLLNEYFFVKQIMMIVIIAFFMLLSYKMHVGKAIILSSLFQGLLLSIDYFTLWLNVSLFHSIEEMNELHYVAGSLIMVLSKLLLFLSVLLIHKKIGEKSSDILKSTDWLWFSFFPVFTIFTIIALIITSGDVVNQKQESVFLVIALCLAGMNILVFYLMNEIMRREFQIRKNKIFQLEVQNQTDMYRSISENFANQRKKTHEYKNQILCIESLVAAKKYEELEKYVKNISGILSTELDYIKTNNVIVDAILNSKYREMLDKNIMFIFKINDLSGIKICDEDIVIILSNLLNNAIEACEKCSDQKVIKMKFVQESENIIISVKNRYNGMLIVQNGEIQTLKNNDTGEHGIGVKNIIEVVAKYQGSYVIRNDESEFYFSIILPLKK